MVTEAAPRKTKRASATPAELPAATPEAPIRAVRKTAQKAAVAATTTAGRKKPATTTVVRKVANTAAADHTVAADSDPGAAGKAKKAKLVRDSFTMPAAEYELLAAMKKRCNAKGLPAKKSQILRAAIIALAAQSDAAIKTAVAALPIIKTGRPAKAGK